MDALTRLVDGDHPTAAFVLSCRLPSPFAMRVEDHAPLAVVVPVDAPLVVVPDAGAEVWAQPGDVVLLRGPDAYALADQPGREPTIVILPGQICTTPDGADVAPEQIPEMLGLRSWGLADRPPTFVCGVYETAAQVSERLLRTLPPVVVVTGGEWSRPLTDILTAETARDVVGQGVVLDRLLDLLLVSAVREWFAEEEGRAPGWWRAMDDPAVGAVLTLVHDRPEHPWTLDELAREVGWSRSGLARRFTDLVGEPPMTYLTRWRLDLAADLLSDRTRGGMTLESVARRVGYGSAFALSTAFKRERGMSPRQFRAEFATETAHVGSMG